MPALRTTEHRTESQKPNYLRFPILQGKAIRVEQDARIGLQSRLQPRQRVHKILDGETLGIDYVIRLAELVREKRMPPVLVDPGRIPRYFLFTDPLDPWGSRIYICQDDLRKLIDQAEGIENKRISVSTAR